MYLMELTWLYTTVEVDSFSEHNFNYMYIYSVQVMKISWTGIQSCKLNVVVFILNLLPQVLL